MNVSRDRLFVISVGFTIVMTIVFAVALAYDITSNRDAGAPRTVSVAAPQGDVTSTDTAAATDTGAAAGPTPAAVAAAPGAATAQHSSASTSAAAGKAPAASAPAQAIPAGSTIVIGGLITQSGPLDASDAYRADEAFVQMINAQGGINGHKLQLDIKDDQGDPSVGRPAFEQIVQEDHALALVGECGPVTDATIVNEINQLQIPVVNDCLSSAPAYASPYIWQTTIAPDVWQALSARYIYKNQDKMKMHKPYVLCVNSSVTGPYCDGFVNEWTRLGGTTCSAGKCNGGHDTEQIATSRAQYEVIANQIKSSGADSIVAELEPTNEAAFMQALRDQGMSPQAWPHYAPLGMDPNSYRSVGSWANGIYVSTADSYFPAENTQGEQQLAQALQQYSPDTPVDNYALAIGWTPMQYFAEALRRLGPNNISRQALIDQLNRMSNVDLGLTRPVTWTPTSHAAPSYTRWATVNGPADVNLVSGWIGPNGDPA
jgi:branched-chain amino acid transport system substrate-binding protein